MPRLSALASVTRTVPDVLLLRLRAHGIVATSRHSVRDLSAEHGVGENRLLAIRIPARMKACRTLYLPAGRRGWLLP